MKIRGYFLLFVFFRPMVDDAIQIVCLEFVSLKRIEHTMEVSVKVL